MLRNITFSHLEINGPTNTHNFTNKRQRGAEKRLPQRNRALHAQYIQARLKEAWKKTSSEIVAGHAEKSGVYLEFKGKVGFDLKTQSLEDMRKKNIRICNIRTSTEKENITTSQGQSVTYATIFVPNDQRNFFTKKVEEYAHKENSKSIKREKIFPKFEQYKTNIEAFFDDINAEKKLKLKAEVSNEQIQALVSFGIPIELINILEKTPKNNELISGIEDVKKAIARSFWVDSLELFPQSNREWCEVWLRGDSSEIEDSFISTVKHLGIPVKEGRIKFPERIVKLVFANSDDLENLQENFDWIAEFRKAKETATFWIDEPNSDQVKWTTDLLSRLIVDREAMVAVCILDHGVNNGHQLISPILDDVDKHTINPIWGTHDHDANGHGTAMAGLVAYGDLQNALESSDFIELSHVLESSKILPPPPGMNEPELWGAFTKQGVLRAEIQAPERKRIICMAITAADTRDEGAPSSWSGALDQMISGIEDGSKRLFLVSTGNYTCSFQDLTNYPDSLITDSVHDPAQAWNAVSVGAYTDLTVMNDPSLNNFKPLASSGEISPFTTTSFVWDKKWPIKPEVVFEGGNIAIEEGSGFPTVCDDLSLLTTNSQPHISQFTSFNMTSAATAQAANFAAKIQTEYPHYWPETIRALMVHSAEWTEGMMNQFAEDNVNKKYGRILRAVGYGVPSIDRALYCARNSLTLVSQAEIQPYEEAYGNSGKKRKTKDMHFYNLPWPTGVLEEMGHIEVEMRITLSYYIEPGPGKIGWKDRYRYPSHLLRFEVNAPSETEEMFLKRINAAMEDDDDDSLASSSTSRFWVIGSQNRDKGSIHSDIWKGTAAELAASNLIAVSPRIGWWKSREYLGRINSKTRYSLIVSIKTPQQDVDIYTPVANKIKIAQEISI